MKLLACRVIIVHTEAYLSESFSVMDVIFGRPGQVGPNGLNFTANDPLRDATGENVPSNYNASSPTPVGREHLIGLSTVVNSPLLLVKMARWWTPESLPPVLKL